MFTACPKRVACCPDVRRSLEVSPYLANVVSFFFFFCYSCCGVPRFDRVVINRGVAVRRGRARGRRHLQVEAGGCESVSRARVLPSERVPRPARHDRGGTRVCSEGHRHHQRLGDHPSTRTCSASVIRHGLLLWPAGLRRAALCIVSGASSSMRAALFPIQPHARCAPHIICQVHVVATSSQCVNLRGSSALGRA